MNITGILIGVFDGHAGSACAQVIAKRLFYYIASCLLPPEELQRYRASLQTPHPLDLIEAFNDKTQFVEDVRDLYANSFKNYLTDLAEVTM